MDEAMRRRVVAGAILIVVGIGLLLLQLFQGFGEWIVLMIIGAAFLVGYFLRRSYGLLIPGCILVGLGLGSIGGASWGVGDFTQIGLGVGFIAIYVIDRIYRGKTHWWPLIPGGVLLITGVASLGENVQRIVDVGWPLLLVLAGIVLIGAAFGLFGKAKAR